MNAIAKTEPMTLTYDAMERLAGSIAKSGLFGIRTTDQAMALMMIASAEGRHPALAARDYDIIGTKPAKKAEAMARDFLEGGGKIEWHELSDAIADATFSHPQGGTVRISWDMERATKAGLSGKENYKKFPRQMLRSRTVSEGVRTIWPSATSGMFVPEEAADIQPFTGTTIEQEPRQAAVPRPRGRDAINAEVPLHTAVTNKRTRGQFLDGLEIALQDAVKGPDAAEEVDRIICGDEVMRAKAEFRNGHIERLNRLIADALVAVTPHDDGDYAGDELPEVVGEAKVGAG